MGRGEIDKPLSLKEKHLTGFSRTQKYNPMQACVQATVSNVNWTMGMYGRVTHKPYKTFWYGKCGTPYIHPLTRTVPKWMQSNNGMLRPSDNCVISMAV